MNGEGPTFSKSDSASGSWKMDSSLSTSSVILSDINFVGPNDSQKVALQAPVH